LGEVSKGDMVPEFEASVFSLKLNEISQPIKTTYGYHIIEVTAITEAKQSTLEEVKEGITSELLAGLKKEAWQKWVDETKADVGVVYQEGMEPTTTTTTAAGETTTTLSADDATTTTAPGATIGTDGTTTTAKP
jgi:hypothetical protein